MRKIAVFITTMTLLATFVTSVQASAVEESRLQQIYAMSPGDMARTGAWVSAAYHRLLGRIDGIQNKVYRDIVRDMVLNPESSVFKAKAEKDAYRISPPTGGPGHHHYPGGLAVHAMENIDIAMGWLSTFDKTHQVSTMDSDLVVAALVLHDWAKVWYSWDEDTGKITKPDWYPKSWGGEDGKAKWKWMGEHGAVVYAELMARGAPEELIVATAAAHFDPQWDLDKDGEGLNPALAEAAKLAGKPAIVVSPDKRMAEWWAVVYSDGAWSFSHYVAGKTAYKFFNAVAQDLGVEPDSAEARKLAWFVLSRVSDFKLYKIYQDAGFSVDAVKEFIISVLEDSSAYELNN